MPVVKSLMPCDIPKRVVIAITAIAYQDHLLILFACLRLRISTQGRCQNMQNALIMESATPQQGRAYVIMDTKAEHVMIREIIR